LITSGQPSEGKTTTVCNTAISLSQLGLKVLLVDADLRRPKLHKTLGAKNTAGLSSYLSRDGKLDDIIQALPTPNLFLMPSGPIPPNPAELLSSDKMRFMLRELSEKYDHIIVDSAPLANLTDSVVLSTMVDGVIIVVHGGKTRREVVRRVHVELAAVGAKIFGVVLNNLDIKRSGYYDYYYYRYNYGYHYKTDVHDNDNGNGNGSSEFI
jgi:capsular exopolysaccharide synthesis family protein